MKMSPFKKSKPAFQSIAKNQAQAEQEAQAAYTTMLAIRMAPLVAVEILDTSRAEAEREEILLTYQRDLYLSMGYDLDLADLIGCAALDTGNAPAGRLFALWRHVRAQGSSTALDELIRLAMEHLKESKQLSKAAPTAV